MLLTPLARLSELKRSTRFRIEQLIALFKPGTIGIEIIKAPVLASNAIACVERRVRSIREECLDHMILNHRHLHRVLSEYMRYYNQTRPYQEIQQEIPDRAVDQIGEGPVRYLNVLNGIIHDYYRTACPLEISVCKVSLLYGEKSEDNPMIAGIFYCRFSVEEISLG